MLLDGNAFLTHLVDSGILPASAKDRVSAAALETHTSVERVILELGLSEEAAIYQALAKHLSINFVDQDKIETNLVKDLGLDLAFLERVGAIPAQLVDGELRVATSDPNMDDVVASLAFSLDQKVTGIIATPSTIKAALNFVRGADDPREVGSSKSDVERLQALANDGPTIALVNGIISAAVLAGASDVHVEAFELGARIRFRIDGALQTHRTISENVRQSVVSRLKIMADLNISEKRRPQDGRAELIVRGRSIDIRLSTLPTQHGESIVLRLLDRTRVQLDWAALHFPDERVAQIQKLTSMPNGIILVAGPTGSGKTTTLYTALEGLNSEDQKIVTVEDPIEYELDGVNQVQVDTAVELTFAKALRAILRQDPNVVMVGEIRDEETAEIAVRAALIGRLVLSTIHTNDAVGAIDRLLDLGVAPYLVGATLRGVISQRLVRANCSDCHGNGCEICGQTGLKGRVAISELLQIDGTLADAISQGSRGKVLAKLAVDNGMVPIQADGERLVQKKVISEIELVSAVGEGR